MAWEIEYTDQFAAWWDSLEMNVQVSIRAGVGVLADIGPTLGRPLVDHIEASRHHNMKELRITEQGREYRSLFAFDPRRTAILLIGGDKTGQWERWYREFIPIADDLYDEHLGELRAEGQLD